MFQTVFRILASLVSLYSVLCLVRIILTWIPSLAYSKVTRVLSQICDPYLNIFRGIKWLRLGSFDFSPALGLCVLGMLSTLLSSFAYGGHITVGLICQMLLQLLWSVVSSLITFIIILLAVRLIMLLVNKGSYSSSPIINQLDSSISPLVYNICKPFSGSKRVSYRSALIIAIVSLLVVQLAGSLIIGIIGDIFTRLPF